jgi:hypothetical protein
MSFDLSSLSFVVPHWYRHFGHRHFGHLRQSRSDFVHCHAYLSNLQELQYNDGWLIQLWLSNPGGFNFRIQPFFCADASLLLGPRLSFGGESPKAKVLELAATRLWLGRPMIHPRHVDHESSERWESTEPNAAILLFEINITSSLLVSGRTDCGVRTFCHRRWFLVTRSDCWERHKFKSRVVVKSEKRCCFLL